ncbi:MAG: sigma-70 family RNA polymerase sigma factor [Phycisphaerae bacterium]|jgi:RNA polymerase sigma factor (sigma-70 family)|nr:sigma-70 family RNA polymerase sigma factor [Phycisphaerae bacterium]
MVTPDQPDSTRAPDPSDQVVHPSATSDEDAWAARVSAGIAAGSRESLGHLYGAKFDLLLTTVMRATRRDESFALDCVQDAMIRVATRIERMPSAASLDAWLRRVVLSAALDRLRKERSDASRAVAAGAQRPTRLADPVDEIATELSRLDHMLHEDRGLLRLRYVAGLTLQQLAEHLGLAPTAVDSRLRRIVDRLRGGEPRPAKAEGARRP